VQRMLASRFTARAFLGTERRLGELTADLHRTDAPFFVASAEVMADVIGFHLNRGVLAAAPRASELSVTDVISDARTVAVLEGVNDHENLGSIFRNAAAFGIDGVVLDPRCADPFARRSIRVSMGHVLVVPWARAAAWPGALADLRAAGFTVAALTPGAGAIPIGTLAAGRTALLLGTEGDGLSDRALAAADVRVRIPMAPGVDSLNVAAASAVAFHRVAATIAE